MASSARSIGSLHSLLTRSVDPLANSSVKALFDRVYAAALAPLLFDSEKVKNRIEAKRYYTQLYFEDDDLSNLCAMFSMDKRPFKFGGIDEGMRVHFLHTNSAPRLQKPLLLKAVAYAVERKAKAIIFFITPAAKRGLGNLLKDLHFTLYEQEDGYDTMINKELNKLKSDLEKSEESKPNSAPGPASPAKSNPSRLEPPAAHSKESQLPIPEYYKACTLMRKYLYMIREGKKPVEGRINLGMFSADKLKVGSGMRFFYQQNVHDDVQCTITGIKTFPTFQAMLSHYGYEKCVPDANSLSHATSIYAKIPGYSEKERKFGVVGIELRVDGHGPEGPAYSSRSQSGQRRSLVEPRKRNASNDDSQYRHTSKRH